MGLFKISNKLQTGTPLQVNGLQVQPVAQIFQLRLGGLAGFVWGRPAAVQVMYPTGQTYRLPVHDETRRLQFLIIGAGLAVTFVITLAARIYRSGIFQRRMR